ncbi:MAG: hypothetical protein CL944_02845 [Candidatus Diapherotrites archaeon]|uniref:Glycerophosphoryl diester phosphodiesterase membrane domain-containing protein n=1 Tax=Candidatus Iainarchaeum sp. TaxID=3101447 RepID=A0A2D6LQD5_9ARCH|nr:hypothetical protein [Candidatus Diapherotrites archaeon]|tara:strand:- start:1974 stop:3143 length:1170 start_codon:yes stop_codon:yes gene_type:complete
MDYGKIVSNCFTLWFKDAKILKYLFSIIILSFVFISATYGLTFLLGYSIEGGSTTINPSDTLLLAVILIPGVLIYAFLYVYLTLLAQVRALQIVGFQTAPFTIGKLIKLIFLEIFSAIIALTSWYHKKWKFYFLGLFFLMLIGVVGAFISPVFLTLNLIALLFGLPYIILIYYNALRLSLSASIFLHKDQGIFDTLHEAWDLGKGNVPSIFVAALLVGILLIVVSIPIMIIALVLQFGAGGLLSPFIGGIISTLFSNAIMGPVLGMFSIFLMPSIYAQLKNQASSSTSKSSEVSIPSQSSSNQSQEVNRRRDAVQNRSAQPIERPVQQVQPKPIMGALTASETNQVEKLMDLLKDKAHDYSKEDLIHVMQEKNYSDKVVNEVLKRLRKN